MSIRSASICLFTGLAVLTGTLRDGRAAEAASPESKPAASEASGASPKAAWGENVPAALEEAKRSGKVVLLNFTGTKWCPPCIRMEKETFSSREFAQYAAAKLVIVKIEFPDPVSFPPEALKLAEKYLSGDGIALPTYVLLSPDGRRLGATSAQPDTKAFLTELDKLAAKAEGAK